MVLTAKLTRYGAAEASPLALRCPACRHQGIFVNLGLSDIGEQSGLCFGQRVCPNHSCRAHVFVVRRGLEVLATYPPERGLDPIS